MFIDVPQMDENTLPTLVWSAYLNITLPWYEDSATAAYNASLVFIFGGYHTGVATKFAFTSDLLTFDVRAVEVTTLSKGGYGPSPRAGAASAISRDTLYVDIM